MRRIDLRYHAATALERAAQFLTAGDLEEAERATNRAAALIGAERVFGRFVDGAHAVTCALFLGGDCDC